jgi:hypothetical protein
MSQDPKISSNFVRKVREHTRRYVHDLTEENGMLRQKAEVLECDKHILEARVTALEAELSQEREERKKLFSRIQDMERQNAGSAAEYAVVESENNNLASLYTATYSLHGTLDREELLRVIQEIVLNLIGSEEIGILELDQDGALRLVASTGLKETSFQKLSLDDGIIGHTVRSGSLYLRGQDDAGIVPAPYESELTACVPLTVESQTIGAIALFRLLVQKRGFESVDYELFDLLGRQAAIALYAAGLHARSANSTSRSD